MKRNLRDMPTVTGHNNTVHKKVLISPGSDKGIVATHNYAWLDEGMSVEKHLHSDGQEYFHFLEGKGAFLIGEEWTDVSPGDFITVPAHTEHSIHNPYPERLVFTTLRTVTSSD